MGGLKQLQRAQPGGQGGNQKRVGRHGTDRVIQVRTLVTFFEASNQTEKQ